MHVPGTPARPPELDAVPPDLRRMIAEAAQVQQTGSSAHFNVHSGFSHRWLEPSVIEAFLRFPEGVQVKFLTIDTADGERHLYAMAASDVVTLLAQAIEAFGPELRTLLGLPTQEASDGND
jgi:hypothetical protein